MDRKEDLLEAQRYRRTQAAVAMFGAVPAHVPQTGPGPWAGPVWGLLLAGALCAVGPVVDAVTKVPPSSGPVTPATSTPGAPVSHEHDGHEQDGQSAPH